MSEIYKIFLTSGLTIIGGVLIYVFGQIILKFFIEPIHEQKRLIGEIVDSLYFYGNVYTTPTMSTEESKKEASGKFRQQATLLYSKTQMITYYRFFSCLRIVHNEGDIMEVYKQLVGLCNSVGNSDHALRHADKIKKLLKLKMD